jgi:hypothetical protein
MVNEVREQPLLCARAGRGATREQNSLFWGVAEPLGITEGWHVKN